MWEGYKQVASADDLDGFPVTLGDPEASKLSKEEQAQVEAAIETAKSLLGKIGNAEQYNVWLSGNVNPYGTERPNQDNHSVTVTVGIAAYPGHSKRHKPGITEDNEDDADEA